MQSLFEPLVCGGCRSCCIGDAIQLYRQHGDIVSDYWTESHFDPISGRTVAILAHKPNKECVYLGPEGCTIYERRPWICRRFDCRELYLRYPRDARRKMVAEGKLRLETLLAGKERLLKKG